MTNFDIIADRIINAEGVSFAIACALGDDAVYGGLMERREALKQAIVEAMEDVLIDTTNAMCKPVIVHHDRSGNDVVD